MLGLQDMSDLQDARLRNSVFTNTALKFAAHTTGEIHDLARAMATEPEFFRSLRKHEFAFFGPDMATAIRVKFPLVEFDRMPQMTLEQYAEMRQRNRERYGYPPPSPRDQLRRQLSDARAEVAELQRKSLLGARAGELIYGIIPALERRLADLEREPDDQQQPNDQPPIDITAKPAPQPEPEPVAKPEPPRKRRIWKRD